MLSKLDLLKDAFVEMYKLNPTATNFVQNSYIEKERLFKSKPFKKILLLYNSNHSDLGLLIDYDPA